MTSHVTEAPRSLARRTSSTVPAVLAWAMCSLPPTVSTSEMSRATIASSEAFGMPRRPSRLAVQPSFITPPDDSSGTSQWLMMGSPRDDE